MISLLIVLLSWSVHFKNERQFSNNLNIFVFIANWLWLDINVWNVTLSRKNDNFKEVEDQGVPACWERHGIEIFIGILTPWYSNCPVMLFGPRSNAKILISFSSTSLSENNETNAYLCCKYLAKIILTSGPKTHLQLSCN